MSGGGFGVFSATALLAAAFSSSRWTRWLSPGLFALLGHRFLRGFGCRDGRFLTTWVAAAAVCVTDGRVRLLEPRVLLGLRLTGAQRIRRWRGAASAAHAVGNGVHQLHRGVRHRIDSLDGRGHGVGDPFTSSRI